MIATAAFATALNPVAAKSKFTADLAGAQADLDFRCVSQWITLGMLSAVNTDAEIKARKAKIDRLDPFVSEAQNSVMDRFHVTQNDLWSIFVVHRDATKTAIDRNGAAHSAKVDTDCLPLIEARESVRTPASPQRCWALEQSASAASFLTGAVGRTQKEDAVVALIPGVLGLLGAQVWRKWAKTALIQSGRNEKDAEKILRKEKKAVDKERKRAFDLGRAVVFDRPNCEKRYQAFRLATTNAQPAPLQ